MSLERSRKLYGWDMLTIARGDGQVFRQELNVDEELRLLGLECAVLFCQNAGELLRPAPGARICPTANVAHQQQDYLIAPVKCLRWLSDKRGKPSTSPCFRLGNKLFWLSPGAFLFDDCGECMKNTPLSKAATCTKQAQKISRHDCPSPKELAAPPIEGAVAFGSKKLPPKPEAHDSGKSSFTLSPSVETQATNLSISEKENNAAHLLIGLESTRKTPLRSIRRLLRMSIHKAEK